MVIANDKQRERLVELLEEAREKSREYFRSAIKKSLAEKKSFNSKTDVRSYIDVEADHLLANGVFVPPCKVGDTVHQICFGKLSEQKIIKQSKVTAIKITDKLTITLDYTTNLYDTDIGYWLFVGQNAKEEAEEALKGGVQG